MCWKVVERYTICRCIYYVHSVDACPAYGRRGHIIKLQDVLVGVYCSRHKLGPKLDPSTARWSVDESSGSAESALTDPSTYSIDERSAFAESALTDHEDCLKEPNIEIAIDCSLRGQLLAKSEKVFDTDEQFIPAGDLEQVFTGHAINAELQSHGLEELCPFVSQRAKKLFAILLVIRKLGALQNLVKEDLGDELLPVLYSALQSLADERLRAAFSGWDLDTRKEFSEMQWTVLVPVFFEAEHLKLDDKARLPFIKTNRIASGGFGSVHRVEIHRDHEKFEKSGSPTSQKGHVYALKQYSQETTNANQRAFDRELAVLRSLHSSRHGHILGHWATFEQRGRYFIVLPLAEENLRQFWANTTPVSGASYWCLLQMTGIAAALSHLHNDLLAQDSRPLSGYHLDIKPENILICVDAFSSRGIWKLSDFGSSYLRPKESRKELPPHPGLGTYEPPECQLNLPQSQAYDLWSLGCIFLECTAWLIKGSDAIDEFAEDRLNDVKVSGTMFKDDYFFTLEFNESSTPVRAVTRPAVIKWIRALERNPRCNEKISELLYLIESGLLQVDQTERLKANYLSERLQLIHGVAPRNFGSGSQFDLQSRPC